MRSWIQIRNKREERKSENQSADRKSGTSEEALKRVLTETMAGLQSLLKGWTLESKDRDCEEDREDKNDIA